MLVLVTAAIRMPEAPQDSGRIRPSRQEVWSASSYVEAIRSVGGTPLVLAPGGSKKERDALLTRIDAVVITGGHFDIDPQHYGRVATVRLDPTDASRTDMELALARDCIRLGIPVLGVCGGMQVLAVASGGTLVQDILTEHPGALDHEQATDPTEAWHPVKLDASSRLASMGEVIQVNSTHHQAVEDPGEMVVTGRAPDGICEVIELPSHRFCVGVQWHPELLDPTPYTALVEAIK
jgi:putative glutamine amidotransferase